MASVDRELEITYGTYLVGGTGSGSERLIDGYIQIDKSFDSLTVSFDFVVTGSTETAFASEVDAAEQSFRDPFQDLLVKIGSETLIDCKPSTNSGFDTQPTIVKGEDPLDTGRSRRYSVSITAGLPADNAPTAGVRDSSVNVSYTPARRRTVTISGVVTAVSGVQARAQYESIIGAFCTSVLNALGGTYELGEEPTTESNYTDKLITFTRIFDELIYEQAPGTPDNVEIVRQMFQVTRGQVGPGDTQGKGAARLINLTATYEAWVDKDQTMDLADVWDGIKGWIYDQIGATLNVGGIAITDSSPTYHYDENRIVASISALGSSGSNVLEHRETTQVANVFGLVLVPAWEGPYAKYSYQGPATRRRTTTTVQRIFGGSSGRGGSSGNPSPLLGSSVLGYGFDLGGMLGDVPARMGVDVPSSALQGGLKNLVGKYKRGGGGGGGGGEGGGGKLGDIDSGSWLLGISLQFSPISLTDTSTPLTIGTDGKTINVVDRTTVLVEEGWVEPMYGGASAGGDTSSLHRGGGGGGAAADPGGAGAAGGIPNKGN